MKLALLRTLPTIGGFLIGLAGLRSWFIHHDYVVMAWPVPDVVLWAVGWLLLVIPLVMLRDIKHRVSTAGSDR